MNAPWVDLFEMKDLRGRARRMFGPAADVPLRVTPAAAVESIAAGPGTFVRLFYSAAPLETLYWLRPNSVVTAVAELTAGPIDSLDILNAPPVAGMTGYELFTARFSTQSEHH